MLRTSIKTQTVSFFLQTAASFFSSADGLRRARRRERRKRRSSGILVLVYVERLRLTENSSASDAPAVPASEALFDPAGERGVDTRSEAGGPALRPGQRLGTHLILAPIAVGGMGEVYRARDTKLGRNVAIKVLPKAFATGDHYARFKREAQVLARLSHPGIAAIYGEEEGALVMELVDGITLAEKIQRGPVALPEALDIARQIADALEYGHSRGIVHRDLKPSNIMLTPGGGVKLLDFGLARVVNHQDETLEDPMQLPTLSLTMTRAGVLLGTSAYMSPEQARGKVVDKRADIWAFGVVLYEMLTGSKLFAGETISDSLASILTHDPDLDRVPVATRKLLQRCLCKDSTRRLRDIGDVHLLLEDIEAGTSAVAKHSPRLFLTILAILAVNGIVIALLSVIGWSR